MGYPHFKSLLRTRLVKAFERRSLSPGYREWGLQRSERDCEGPLELAMIVNESDEARTRHRDVDPDHRRSLLRQGGVGSCLFFDSETLAAHTWNSIQRERDRGGPAAERRGRTAGCTMQHLKARGGVKTRPKASRREQQGDVSLRVRGNPEPS